ncbi:MAG: hypothetical protein M3502_00870 [Actinomycetota bacterium]|nr:hypothetical protein [Actinomycetota bacterium]
MKLSPGLGEKSFWMSRVPPRVAVPLTASWSSELPGLEPSTSVTSVPAAVWV